MRLFNTPILSLTSSNYKFSSDNTNSIPCSKKGRKREKRKEITT